MRKPKINSRKGTTVRSLEGSAALWRRAEIAVCPFPSIEAREGVVWCRKRGGGDGMCEIKGEGSACFTV